MPFQTEENKTTNQPERTMNDTPTPRTDEFAADHDFQPQPHQCLNFASKIERELTAVTEQRDAITLRLGRTQERMFDAERQRDRLAEALESIVGESAYEGLPELKQLAIEEALQSLTTNEL
jgi:hypothetical protein